jgi:hypothetical protein
LRRQLAGVAADANLAIEISGLMILILFDGIVSGNMLNPVLLRSLASKRIDRQTYRSVDWKSSQSLLVSSIHSINGSQLRPSGYAIGEM